MRVIQSQSADIRRNLAAEEWLLSEKAPALPLLFLWQSAPAVVIGKNQNPWLECRPGFLEEQGVRLARRVSGGGAVYHDAGNLNYAFILSRATYRRDALFARIISALAPLGLRAERLGRSGLGIGGRKFSGTAFCYRGDRVLHHGTLLVSADLQRLDEVLLPALVDIHGRAVPSERATVMNLSEAIPGLTVERVAAALSEGHEAMDAPPDPALAMQAEKHESPAWVFGNTPPFETGVLGRRVRVEQGIVAKGPWAGCPFRSRDLAARLEGGGAQGILAPGLSKRKLSS
ncbi:MAG: lipoate--protein ligase family protein [Kiritimatiellae bacterium]|nr:lipoate--protein ligase family protein [Kiritimatiellia bacterium]